MAHSEGNVSRWAEGDFTNEKRRLVGALRRFIDTSGSGTYNHALSGIGQRTMPCANTLWDTANFAPFIANFLGSSRIECSPEWAMIHASAVSGAFLFFVGERIALFGSGR